tara:strand:+ start:463 stop:660 length:198 start_codon:yes stop_codon:yes gene_type:complete
MSKLNDDLTTVVDGYNAGYNTGKMDTLHGLMLAIIDHQYESASDVIGYISTALDELDEVIDNESV